MTRNDSLSTADIALFAARGRRLHGRAIRGFFADLGRWAYRTAAIAVGRRATVRLGCTECGVQA